MENQCLDGVGVFLFSGEAPKSYQNESHQLAKHPGLSSSAAKRILPALTIGLASAALAAQNTIEKQQSNMPNWLNVGVGRFGGVGGFFPSGQWDTGVRHNGFPNKWWFLFPLDLR